MAGNSAKCLLQRRGMFYCICMSAKTQLFHIKIFTLGHSKLSDDQLDFDVSAAEQGKRNQSLAMLIQYIIKSSSLKFFFI